MLQKAPVVSWVWVFCIDLIPTKKQKKSLNTVLLESSVFQSVKTPFPTSRELAHTIAGISASECRTVVAELHKALRR